MIYEKKLDEPYYNVEVEMYLKEEVKVCWK